MQLDLTILNRDLRLELTSTAVNLNMTADRENYTSEINAVTRQSELVVIGTGDRETVSIWLRAGTSQHGHTNLHILERLSDSGRERLAYLGRELADYEEFHLHDHNDIYYTKNQISALIVSNVVMPIAHLGARVSNLASNISALNVNDESEILALLSRLFTFDAEKNAIKANYSLYSVGEITAAGATTEEEDVSFIRLDRWEDYVSAEDATEERPTTEGWVLSAKLGYMLLVEHNALFVEIEKDGIIKRVINPDLIPEGEGVLVEVAEGVWKVKEEYLPDGLSGLILKITEGEEVTYKINPDYLPEDLNIGIATAEKIGGVLSCGENTDADIEVNPQSGIMTVKRVGNAEYGIFEMIEVGGVCLVYDADLNALKIYKKGANDTEEAVNFLSLGEITAGEGENTGGSGTGGGTVTFDRLDSWEDYNELKAGFVLSALLGYDLFTRINALFGTDGKILAELLPAIRQYVLPVATADTLGGVRTSADIGTEEGGAMKVLKITQATDGTFTDFVRVGDAYLAYDAQTNTLKVYKLGTNNAEEAVNFLSLGEITSGEGEIFEGEPTPIITTLGGLSNVIDTADDIPTAKKILVRLAGSPGWTIADADTLGGRTDVQWGIANNNFIPLTVGDIVKIVALQGHTHQGLSGGAGNATTPIYLDAYGIPQPCTNANMTVGAATKLTNGMSGVNKGSNNTPVYFVNGEPVATTNVFATQDWVSGRGFLTSLPSHSHSEYLTAITKAMIEGLLTGNITSHTHSRYAESNHDHEGVYAESSHNHDGVYLKSITKAMVEDVLVGENITSHKHDSLYHIKNGSYSEEMKAIRFSLSNTAFINLSDGNINFTTHIKVNGNISSTGEVTAGVTSDRRLKANIRDLEEVDAEEVLSRLRPVSFVWNDRARELNSEKFGIARSFIADEFLKVLPNAGRRIYGEYDAIYIEQVIPYLVKGWQSQQKKIDEQQKRIEDLEKKLERLMKIIENYEQQ